MRINCLLHDSSGQRFTSYFSIIPLIEGNFPHILKIRRNSATIRALATESHFNNRWLLINFRMELCKIITDFLKITVLIAAGDPSAKYKGRGKCHVVFQCFYIGIMKTPSPQLRNFDSTDYWLIRPFCLIDCYRRIDLI